MPVIYEEARTAGDCTQWLHHCKAECCKTTYIKGVSQRLRKGQLVRVELEPISADMKWYYELHGIRVDKNVISFRATEFEQKGDLLVLKKPCANLTSDYKCGEWHSGNRPEWCKVFTLDTAKGYRKSITPNCLYKYKIELEDQ